MQEEYLEDLVRFLSFPSISTDAKHRVALEDCADWLAGKLARIGLSVEKFATRGHPVLVAKNNHRKGRPTVMYYGHYDVQPVDPIGEWKSPPFEPAIRDGVIYARGATDNKGQLLAHVLGMQETLAAEGDLPVNAVLLFEGEEEIGSPNLAPFLREHREMLACDVAAVSDTGMVARGVPTLTYGLRGIACLELKVKGPAVDLHSGIYGGSVANPATAAAELAASLHNPEGRVAIEGFYASVRPLENWEREAWRRIGDGEADTLAQTGVPALFGEAGYSSFERRWARPTAEVNGIGGGYQGPGSKTVIPREALVKLSFRLVPDQDPEEILELAARHLQTRCPPGVRLEIELGHWGRPYVMDAHSRFGLAAQSALREAFDGREPALIREGGSIPIIGHFREVLGADTLMLGLALPDCMCHAPNENLVLENFEAGIRLNRRLLAAIAKVG